MNQNLAGIDYFEETFEEGTRDFSNRPGKETEYSAVTFLGSRAKGYFNPKCMGREMTNERGVATLSNFKEATKV